MAASIVHASSLDPSLVARIPYSFAKAHGVLAYASARLRQNRVRIIAGDKVTLEISPYDLTRGRINFRHKDERPAVVAPRRYPPRRK